MMKLYVLPLNLLLTGFMVGLIWFVQRVHYPSFAMVGKDRFPLFHAFHMRRIFPLVAIAMLAEMVAGVWLLLGTLGEMPWLSSATFMALPINWMLTAVVFIPMHGRLAQNFNVQTVQQLVRWNWVRTTCWTVRLLLLFYLSFSV